MDSTSVGSPQWLVVTGKERKILNISEVCQFLISVLGLFAKTANKKVKKSLWTSSAVALTYPHFLSGPLKSQTPLNGVLCLHQSSEPSGEILNSSA